MQIKNHDPVVQLREFRAVEPFGFCILLINNLDAALAAVTFPYGNLVPVPDNMAITLTEHALRLYYNHPAFFKIPLTGINDYFIWHGGPTLS